MKYTKGQLQSGAIENTLVIFTSDNGPVWYPEDYEKYQHNAVGPLRGMKGDLWEGGHRMPFIVSWPGHVAANTTNDNLVCFTDFMTTFAEIMDQELLLNACEDSYSFFKLIIGSKSDLPKRTNFVVKVSRDNKFAIRTKDLKYINIPGPGGFTERYLKTEDNTFDLPKQLNDFKNDIGESNNLFPAGDERVKDLEELSNEIVKDNIE